MSQHTSPPHVSALEDHVGYWLRFVSNHVSHSFQLKVEARGATVSEWVLMRQLYEARELSPSALAQQIGMTRGAISKLITRLEAKGLITRQIHEADRRNHIVALSEAGRALVPELAALADENDAAFFGHLDDAQRQALIDVMRQIVTTRQLKALPVE